jgi:hypothetical protein
VAFEVAGVVLGRVASSHGAPSEMTISTLRGSGRRSSRACAQSSASPSTFSLSKASSSITAIA